MIGTVASQTPSLDIAREHGIFVAVSELRKDNLHAQVTERAAGKGVHVLCEKPMAVTAAECERMIDACRENNVKLMIAYRLHFEVRVGNIRTRAELGGDPVYDIGIYCINAARNLFRDEPTEVFAFGAKSDDRTSHRKFPMVDQFAPELPYFSRCILEHRGLADESGKGGGGRSAPKGRAFAGDSPPSRS